MLGNVLSKLIENSVGTNHINSGMPWKWSASLFREFVDSIEESVCVRHKATIQEQMQI